jgi:carboxyl-terminal processing protease
MGRFVEREGYYQKHSIPSEERLFGVPRTWTEMVSPRGEFRYVAPMVVLVDHWTGSMGEGIAIGMDGLKRATVVGTPMAGLLGATSGITLPNSKIGVNFPTEKLFHVNGTPREDFVPPVTVDLLKTDKNAKDAVLETGLRTLQELIKQGSTK